MARMGDAFFLDAQPAGNLLRQFPAQGRPILLLDSSAEAHRMAKRLATDAGVEIVTRMKGTVRPSIVIGAVEQAPVLWRRLFHDVKSRTIPLHFLWLAPHLTEPTLWIGGSRDEDSRRTAALLVRFAPLLLDGVLASGDFHVHTNASDGRTLPEDVPLWAVRAGLDVLAVTDHNATSGAHAARKHAAFGFPVLVGEELTDAVGNHILLFGLDAPLPAKTPREKVLALWRAGRLTAYAAHATDPAYFTEHKGTAFGMEAFNYLSSAPEAARDFAAKRLRAGYTAPVIGCSDAHLPEGIGMARTFFLLQRLDESSVLEALRKGAGVAFFRGEFCGEPVLAKQLADLHCHSNLIEGKLVPLSAMARHGAALLRPRAKPLECARDGERWRVGPLRARRGVLKIVSHGSVEGHIDGTTALLCRDRGMVAFERARPGCGTLALRTTGGRAPDVSLMAAGAWRALTPHATPEANIFCADAPCECREAWFRLDEHSGPLLLRTAPASEAEVLINGRPLRLTLRQGMEVECRPWAAGGENVIEWPDRASLEMLHPRLLLGWEVRRWQFRAGEAPWRTVSPASNLQCQGLLPLNYAGTFEYRATIPAARLALRNPTLLFQGVDGNLEAIANDRQLLARYNMHWEDPFEVPLTGFRRSNKSLRLQLRFTNRVGLSGMTNRVHLAESIPLRFPVTRASDPGRATSLRLIRCGEPAVRAFLCDEKFAVQRTWFAGGAAEPVLVEAPRRTPWLVLNAFGGPYPSPRPETAALSRWRRI